MTNRRVGEWVFAYYPGDSYWYPAKITSIEGERIEVCYEFDDSKGWLDPDRLASYNTYPGEEGAECWWEEDDAYYAVSIIETSAEDVLVKYEDGEEEWTDLCYLRFED